MWLIIIPFKCYVDRGTRVCLLSLSHVPQDGMHLSFLGGGGEGYGLCTAPPPPAVLCQVQLCKWTTASGFLSMCSYRMASSISNGGTKMHKVLQIPATPTAQNVKWHLHADPVISMFLYRIEQPPLHPAMCTSPCS